MKTANRSSQIFALLVAASTGGAATFQENFSGNQATNGWRVAGDTSLFHWNATQNNLQVTWDSSRSNSFFHHPLGTVLAKSDDFSLGFDLRLSDAAIGVNPSKPYTFELAVGFINLAEATATNFFRGTRLGTRHVVEFDYFPAFLSFGATVALTAVSSNSLFAYSHNFPLELTLDDLFRVSMRYTASNHTLATTITRNLEPFAPIASVVLDASFSDFRLDTFAVSSYRDERADGSILAHGFVDNINFTVPPAAVATVTGAFAGQVWQVQFLSQTNWFYTLERTSDFQNWISVAPTTIGTGATLILSDANPPLSSARFYRVRASRP